MSKQVQVTVDHEQSDRVLRALNVHSRVHGLATFDGKKCKLIIFKCVGRHLQEVLHQLHDLGVC